MLIRMINGTLTHNDIQIYLGFLIFIYKIKLWDTK
jgi:hypothetical protein